MGYLDLIQIIKNKILPSDFGYFGDYENWSSALQQSSGYDAENILEKVKESMIKVKNGEAIYERDSVLFDKIQYSWPLLSALMWIAAVNKGKLNVLDFGGSLGSSYFQNKLFLTGLDSLKWNVVEQESFVKCGRDFIQNEQLHFFSTIEEAIKFSNCPDVILVSGTLPYISEPFELISKLAEYNFPYLLIDNTPFNYMRNNRITIQKVHPSIYNASYPCWLLDYDNLVTQVQKKYTIISEHNNDLFIYVDGRKIQYKGFLAKSKTPRV